MYTVQSSYQYSGIPLKKTAWKTDIPEEKIHVILNHANILFTFSDESFDDDEGMLEDSTSEVTKVITSNSESNFQRKITVSQTQL